MDSAEKPYYDSYKLDAFEVIHHLDSELTRMKQENKYGLAGEVAVMTYSLRIRDILHKRMGLESGGDHVMAS